MYGMVGIIALMTALGLSIIVNHPVRRRIVMWLMMVRSGGLITPSSSPS